MYEALSNRNLKIRFVCGLVCFFLISCAAPLPYSLNYPLSNEPFFSRDGSFYGLVPEGWFVSSGDSLAPALSAWLVKEDFTAVLTIRELHLDPLSSAQVERKGLILLANISIAIHSADSSITAIVVPPKEYSMQGRKFCSYEVYNGDIQKRIVVFAGKGKYYESEAVTTKGAWLWDDLVRLFTAQQAFLASLVI